MAFGRAAGVAIFDARDRDQHIGGAILIQNHAPPDAPAAASLARVDQQRVGAGARGADIIDRALPRIIFGPGALPGAALRSEEHTSELQSLMRISYAVFCLKKQTIV